MPEEILTLSGLSKTFRTESGEEVQALRNVDLKLSQGEFVVLIGPTGCGKTTLLNIVGGLESHDDGEIRLSASLKEHGRISCVFQHYTLFPWRTVLGNVTFGLEMRNVGKKQRLQTASDLLEKVGLGGFEDTYPHELSGGMRQRAAIAQASAVEPKLLLMDEPFGALDGRTRTALQSMVVELWQGSDVTVLFVTHNIDEAIAVADRVVVMSERPGRAVGEIEIDLPRPRQRTGCDFAHLAARIRDAMVVDG